MSPENRFAVFGIMLQSWLVAFSRESVMAKGIEVAFCMALAVGELSAGEARAAASLCTPGERVVFSCQLKDSRKTVSLCASRKAPASSGYLQYRFGSPAKLELSYPPERARPKGRFTLVHTQYIRSGEYGLQFTVNTNDYSLGYIAEGPDGSLDRYALFVTRANVDAPIFTDNCYSRPPQTNSFYPLTKLSKELGVRIIEKTDDGN